MATSSRRSAQPPRTEDLAQRMAASLEALKGYAVPGIQEGVVKEIVDLSMALGAWISWFVEWHQDHPGSECSKAVLRPMAELAVKGRSHGGGSLQTSPGPCSPHQVAKIRILAARLFDARARLKPVG